MSEAFRKFAHIASRLSGSVIAFTLAVVFILVWALAGPIFGFSNRWQLVVNTGTTIVTFLMVFLIQNTQNRDSQAIHAKLDELLFKAHNTDNRLLRAEELSDEELEKLKAHYEQLASSVGERRTRVRQAKPAGSANGTDSSKRATAARRSPNGRTTRSRR